MRIAGQFPGPLVMRQGLLEIAFFQRAGPQQAVHLDLGDDVADRFGDFQVLLRSASRRRRRSSVRAYHSRRPNPAIAMAMPRRSPNCRWASNCSRHSKSRLASPRSSAVPLLSSFAREFMICGEPARRLAVLRRRVFQKSVRFAQLGDAFRAPLGRLADRHDMPGLGFLLGRGRMGDDLSAKPCRVLIPLRLVAAVPHVVTQLGDRQDQPGRSAGVFLQVRQSGGRRLGPLLALRAPPGLPGNG